VKFAAASVGAAEATDAAVRRRLGHVRPFEALDIFTLAAGEQRAVSAFAYDAAGLESPKATVMVKRPSATGVTDAEFLVGAAHAKLSAERVVQAASSISGHLATAARQAQLTRREEGGAFYVIDGGGSVIDRREAGSCSPVHRNARRLGSSAMAALAQS
jgi:hypothetical protein